MSIKAVKKFHGVIKRAVTLLQHRLSHRQFFILSSVVVGLCSGLAAILLKYLVHQIGLRFTPLSARDHEIFLFALLPLAGITFCVLFTRQFLVGEPPKGSAEIRYAIAKKSSIIPLSQTYSHLVTSMLTIGFGGSLGLESPMVSTGSAIGSNYSRTYGLNYKEKTILLAAGAAAGIAAAFNSPIAGVLFAVEVLLTDVAVSAFIPLIIAAASSALLSKMILEEGVALSFTLQQPFDYANVPFYIALGILAGFVALYHAKVTSRIDKTFSKFKNPWVKLAVGGLLLACLLILFPPLFGEGYDTIKFLSNLQPQELIQTTILHPWIENDWQILVFLFVVMMVKVLAASLTLAAGGNGGSFAPSMFIGAYLGFVFSRLVNLSGLAHIPESNFTLVAMAGILGGVFYAPLSAIFLIAEITGGYGLIIPLMIVSAISISVVKYFEPISPETKKLSEKVKHAIEDHDTYLLSKLNLNELIEQTFLPVQPGMSLKELTQVIAKSARNTFPVVDHQSQLLGLIHLDNIRNLIFNNELLTTTFVRDIMSPASVVVSPSDSLHDVLKKFDEIYAWNLPVVIDNKYVGFVSKATILSRYRAELLSTV